MVVNITVAKSCPVTLENVLSRFSIRRTFVHSNQISFVGFAIQDGHPTLLKRITLLLTTVFMQLADTFVLGLLIPRAKTRTCRSDEEIPSGSRTSA